MESLIDIASIGYDIYDISTNGLNWENGLSLAADVASLALPVVAGGGLAVRAAMHADDAVDAVRAANAAADVAQTANQLDNAVDASRAAHVTPSDLYAFGNRAGPRPPYIKFLRFLIQQRPKFVRDLANQDATTVLGTPNQMIFQGVNTSSIAPIPYVAHRTNVLRYSIPVNYLVIERRMRASSAAFRRQSPPATLMDDRLKNSLMSYAAVKEL